MGAKLLAAIERLRKAPWVVLALLLVSAIGALAQFTGATKTLVDLVRPAKPDARAELVRLGIPFTPEALTKAAKDGDAKAVALLLDAGMAPDATANPALPPLVVAAQAGQVAVARSLRDAGADPAKDSPGHALFDPGGSPLAYAARSSHPDVVKLFLERAIPDDAIVDAIGAAARSGDGASVRLLAPRLRDRRTAATLAMRMIVGESGMNTQAPAFADVLALGPDLNAIDANGQSLLHIAVNNDAGTVLGKLLAARANPDVRAKCETAPEDPRVTPLACAVVRGSVTGLDSVRRLIAAHADLNARGPDGSTPLMLAAGNGDADVTAALLAAGADPALRDARGKAALDYARTAADHDPTATSALLSRAAAPRRS